jgi:hypothetical protein
VNPEKEAVRCGSGFGVSGGGDKTGAVVREHVLSSCMIQCLIVGARCNIKRNTNLALLISKFGI